MATNQERKGSGGMGNTKKHKKYVKRKEDDINLELGEGIKLHDIMTMEDSALVVRFARKRMSIETIKAWTSEFF